MDIEKDTNYRELIFVNLDLLDEDGLFVADAANELSITLEGPAQLLGFGSCGVRHQRGYEQPVTTALDGHALAILKRTGDAGTIRVSVTGEGLEAASADI